MKLKKSTQVNRYVLSAGRTGTVFLSKLLEAFEVGIEVEHEPAPSRYLMMMGNARNDLGIFNSLTRRWSHSLQDKHHAKSKRYIEINPFLCPLVDTLLRDEHDLNILHIVRHPADWSQSITSFKASAKLRSIVDYVPFAKPYPSPRPKYWRKLGDYEKALWRWNWCNSRISDLQRSATRYELIRYEDLFSSNASLRLATVAKVFKLFELTNLPDAEDPIFNQRVNPSPKKITSENSFAEKEICGELAKSYGYDL